MLALCYQIVAVASLEVEHDFVAFDGSDRRRCDERVAWRCCGEMLKFESHTDGCFGRVEMGSDGFVGGRFHRIEDPGRGHDRRSAGFAEADEVLGDDAMAIFARHSGSKAGFHGRISEQKDNGGSGRGSHQYRSGKRKQREGS